MKNSKAEVVKLELWSKIVICIIAVLIVVLNSIEIHVLRKTVKKPFYEKLLMSLSISDLSCGLFVSVTVPYLSLVENELYVLLHWNVWGFGICYVTFISLMHLIIISVDRLWAVRAPIHHRQNTTKRKIVIAVALSWGIPMIFVIVSIGLVVHRGMKPADIYWFGTGTMFTVVARVVLTADIVLIVCYAVIIWIIKVKKSVARQSLKDAKTMKTVVLCFGIVSVFVCFTTPFVVVFITNWSTPHWMIKVGMMLFTLNQISNSIVYLTQKYRSNRSIGAKKECKTRGKASMESPHRSTESEEVKI